MTGSPQTVDQPDSGKARPRSAFACAITESVRLGSPDSRFHEGRPV
jgi:hypothetical protein